MKWSLIVCAVALLLAAPAAAQENGLRGAKVSRAQLTATEAATAAGIPDAAAALVWSTAARTTRSCCT
jgi:hypothetical protein